MTSDLDMVLEVLRLSLGEPPGLNRTPQLFAWKHFDNPFGRSLMLVAEEHGRIAGFRAFMRWELVASDGVKLRCVRAVDTATHPDFQRRGIFKALTLAGIDAATAEGIDLIFNTPNEKSGPGYLEMGWREVGRIGVMMRPSVGLVGKRHRAEGSRLTEMNRDRLTALEADRSPAGLRTPRSSAYLLWRFARHPTARYLLAGELDVFAIGRFHDRRGRRELVISELGGPGSWQRVNLLRKATRPDYTVGWFRSGTPERRAAIRSGLLPIPGLRALKLMTRPLRDLSVDLEWRNWDLSLGDLELL